MFTHNNEDTLLSLRSCFYRDPNTYQFNKTRKLLMVYKMYQIRNNLLQKFFNKWSNKASSFMIVKIGKIESYSSGYNSPCTGSIICNQNSYICLSEDFFNIFLKYFAKKNDYVIFLEKNSRAYGIWPIFNDTLSNYSNMRINGIVDNDRSHIRFVFRGQKHRVFTRHNYLTSGDFVTFLLRQKKHNVYPIKIRSTLSSNTNCIRYSPM